MASQKSYPTAIFLILGWLLSSIAPSFVTAQTISNTKLYGKSAQAAHQVLEQYGTMDDPEARERVANIGYRLAAQSEFRDFPFSFHLIEMPEPNAFALPGGHLFVTRGMLNLGLTDDMLAALLGHEIAHVTKRHGIRMQRRATLFNLLSQAAVIGVLVGASDEPENPRDPYGIDYSGSRKGSLVQGTAAAGMVISELLLRDYSRSFEDEADVVGQRLAAAAGFDPDGARQLWELMNQRMPPSRKYGYWRTHPFSDQRMRAAEVRAQELKIQEPKPDQDFRASTQKVILAFDDLPKEKTPVPPPLAKPTGLRLFLDDAALAAWPRGPRAEELRLDALHRQRDAELRKDELERDYGALVREYQVQIAAVRRLTPQTAFIATLESQLEDLRQESQELYPKAIQVWDEGFYQTPFLVTFLSNYPTAPAVPDVALALGNAYSRLGRQSDGVEQYLRAAEAGPESEAGKRALQGLRNLAPVLEELVALQKLSDDIDDEALENIAQKRLAEVVPKYENITYGAEYLRRYPEGTHADKVQERLEALAQNLYGEVVLYQGLGDHVKALERIQKILAHAPQTAAAEALRDQVVLDT